MIRKDFGNWLRNEIKVRGRTQAEFAKLLNIEQPHLSHIINGSRGPSDEVLEKISIALNLPMETILIEAGKLKRKPNYNPKVQEAIELLNQLKASDLEEIIFLARIKIERDQDNPSKKPSRKQTPAQIV